LLRYTEQNIYKNCMLMVKTLGGTSSLSLMLRVYDFCRFLSLDGLLIIYRGFGTKEK